MKQEARSMTTQKSLIGLFAIAVLSTCWCVVAAVEEDDAVETVEIKMKFADCPAAVQKTLQLESVGAELKEVVEVTEDGKKVYMADVTFDGREYEIVVDEAGTLLAKVLNDDDEITTELKFSDCPVAVQKTLKRESRGAEIETVDKVVNDEKTGYLIDVKIDGKNYALVVAENGILISKLLDEEDEEGDKKSDEQEKKT
jgi:hypothetical protein